MDKKRRNRRILKRIKSFLPLISIAFLLLFATTGSYAFLSDFTDWVANTFAHSDVVVEIHETFENNEKKDVYISNEGKIDAWIRATYIVTWQDANGNVYGEYPVEGTNYTISLNTTSSSNGQWLEGKDGFYYWSKPVTPKEATNNQTGNLIDSLTYITGAPDDYSLHVEILASGIQSQPISVFNTEWENPSFIAVEDSTSGCYLKAK